MKNDYVDMSASFSCDCDCDCVWLCVVTGVGGGSIQTRRRDDIFYCHGFSCWKSRNSGLNCGCGMYHHNTCIHTGIADFRFSNTGYLTLPYLTSRRSVMSSWRSEDELLKKATMELRWGSFSLFCLSWSCLVKDCSSLSLFFFEYSSRTFLQVLDLAPSCGIRVRFWSSSCRGSKKCTSFYGLTNCTKSY